MNSKFVFLKSQFLAIFIGLLPIAGLCESTGLVAGPDVLFKQGIAEFRASKFADSTRTFQSLLLQEPNNPGVLTNLGMCSLKIGQKGWAIAYFRKALSLDHSLNEARDGMQEALSKLEVKELPRQNSWYESFRDNFLTQLSIDFVVILTLVTFLLFAWWLLSYLGQRRRQAKAELPPPAVSIPMIVVGFFFVALSGVAILKLYDTFHVVRGTVVSQKSAMFSAPEASQSVLFEIYEGLEVEILGSSGDFYQVQYPGGAAGWMLKKDVFITD